MIKHINNENSLCSIFSEMDIEIYLSSKIKKIHDFTILAAPSSMISRSNDKYLTTKVRTRILATAIFKKEKNVKSNRIKVVTDNSTVFLLGIVNGEQAEIATKTAAKPTKL